MSSKIMMKCRWRNRKLFTFM